MQKQKTKLILNLISLTLCSVLLVISIFGWYATNKQASVTGGMGATSNHRDIQYVEIEAKRYNLSGDFTHNIYTVSSDKIILNKSEKYTVVSFKNQTEFDKKPTNLDLYTRVGDTFTKDTSTTFSDQKVYYTYDLKNTFTDSDNRTFNFLGMLPGEYVDIKVTYTMDDSMDGNNYRIQLRNLSGGAFRVDGHTHYAYGAYSYMLLGLTPKTGTISFTPDTDYTFFKEYDIKNDDEDNINVELYSGTWDKSYEELSFSFRIMEDFTEYYKLLGKAENTYGNLLNQKEFNIQSLFIVA